MRKETDKHRKAILKYRSEKVKFVQLQYPIRDFRVIDAYCKYINTPIATWVKSLIKREIDSDKSFVYTPTDEPDIDIKRRNRTDN